MRTVLKNSAEVAHYWANKVQGSGRNSTGNIGFGMAVFTAMQKRLLLSGHSPMGQNMSSSVSPPIPTPPLGINMMLSRLLDT